MKLSNPTSDTPIVSIVIPTHNCLEYLPKALDSIFNQRLCNIEILIIDDNSSDGTWQWLQEIQQQHPQIRPYKLRGVGSARARNFALKRVRSELVAFLDADDYWHDNKLLKQVRFHRDNPNVVLSFTNYHHTTPEQDDLGDCFTYWPHFNAVAEKDDQFHVLPDATDRIYSENVIGTSCVMIRTKVLKSIGGFDHTLKSAEDWDLWMRFCRVGKIGYCRQQLMEYLVRPGSKTSNRLRRLDHMKIIMNRYKPMVRRSNIWAVLHAQGRLEIGYAEHFAEQGNFARACWHQLKGFLCNPSQRNLRASMSFAWHSWQQMRARRKTSSLS